MAHTTASQYQANAETYMAGAPFSMIAYPSDFDSVSQVLTPGVEYFSCFVNQSLIIRQQSSNANRVELQIRLLLLYRFITNEAEYTGSGDTPTKLKAVLAVLMDEKFWRGGTGMALTSPLSVHDIEGPEAEITRTGRVIETEITVTLVTTSV